MHVAGTHIVPLSPTSDVVEQVRRGWVPSRSPRVVINVVDTIVAVNTSFPSERRAILLK